MTQFDAVTAEAAPASPAATASETHVVACRGLTKVFKDFWHRDRVTAVSAVDLTIRRGEVFGLLGPNGSGKSTTIKMILGLLRPTSGRVAVFGNPPEDVATKKRIGYLPEESYLYRFLNARETLEYYGRLFHQTGGQRSKRIDMLLDMVGLTHAQRRPVGEFSKGMQRKVGLAQALINDPELLILDEPTTGMDPLATADVKRLILTLKQRGKTVLLCSHLLADVEDVCDRVAVMFGGKVRQEGTVDDLLTADERTTLTAESLDAADVAAVEQALLARGKHLDQVDRPRRRLEELFLEIVERAQAEGLATSGARSGGAIAEFLSDGRDDAEPEGDAVLSRLMSTSPAAGDETAPSTPDQTPSEPGPRPSAEEDALASLLDDPSHERSRPSAPAATPAAQPPDAPADRAVIDDLLGPTDEDERR